MLENFAGGTSTYLSWETGPNCPWDFGGLHAPFKLRLQDLPFQHFLTVVFTLSSCLFPLGSRIARENLPDQIPQTHEQRCLMRFVLQCSHPDLFIPLACLFTAGRRHSAPRLLAVTAPAFAGTHGQARLSPDVSMYCRYSPLSPDHIRERCPS